MSTNDLPETMTTAQYRALMGLENDIPTSPAKTTKRKPRATTGGNGGQTVAATEHDIQAAFFAWAKWEGINRPDLDLMFAIPNGGKRHPATGAKMKEEGVRAGVPDVCLPVGRAGYHALYIEFKRKGNKPSPEQWAFIDRLMGAGNCVRVCYSFDEAQRVAIDYLEDNLPPF